MSVIINILILTVCIFLVSNFMPGIRIKNFPTAIVVAVVYSVINFLVGWLLVLLTLPFFMKFGDHRGVGGFLLDYFESHRDISHGVFSSARPRIGYLCPQFFTTSADPKDHRCSDFHRDTCLELTADVWLAPFDFGIMQQAVIHFCASVDNPGFLEIRILLERKAGEANAWLRINKAFLHQLRKQMLTWHSLTPQMQQHYRERLSVSPPSDRLEK